MLFSLLQCHYYQCILKKLDVVRILKKCFYYMTVFKLVSNTLLSI
jgi:hypothetical protein